MNILSVHNQYMIRGGEDESAIAECQLLRQHGHTVTTYSETNKTITQNNLTKLARDTIWSKKTYQNITQILQQDHYDVVHVHNFFPLISPSVYYAAKDAGVAVVQTLHNYRLLCANGLFFRNGQICHDCLNKPIPYPGLIHSCYRSRPATAVTIAMVMTHHALGTWKHHIDRYIVMSEKGRSLFTQSGFPTDKIHVKPHFVDPDPGIGLGDGNYALFVGRLSVEKGLDLLIQAWQILDHPLPLKIVGNGPLEPALTAATQQSKSIQLLGSVPLEQVYELMKGAAVVIFPSKWHETFGRVIIEALAVGTPVIASRLGASPELITTGKTGYLFEPNNPESLAAAVKEFLRHPDPLALRRAARQSFEQRYTAAQNYEQLMDIYRMVCNP